MKVVIEKSTAKGSIKAPPSKSIAHRALICGALSGGLSKIDNLSYSKDIEATIDCLVKMGAVFKKQDDSVTIGSLDIFNMQDGIELFCNESGSTLRFIIPLCAVSGKRITLSGSERLFERPLTVYEEIFKKQGIFYEKNGSKLTVCGKLKSGDYSVRGDISSQFITGLLFALPLAEGDSTLTVTGRFESASYIDITLNVLASYGICIQRFGNIFKITGGQKYIPRDYTVEGDCSNAAFLDGFNMFGGNVEVNGIAVDTLQGDRVYADMYRRIKNGEKKFDLSDCPDLAPVMFAVAAYCGGAEFEGTSRLKIKESDRASAMAEELLKFGINTQINDNSVIIQAGVLKKPTECLYGHNDHRIVMALSLLCSVTGGVIDGAEAVSKSYPDYFGRIKELGIIVV